MVEHYNKILSVLKKDLKRINEELIDNTDIFYEDQDGRNYLHLSVYLRSDELVKWFIEKGLSVDSEDRSSITPLHLACRHGNEAVTNALIENGADCYRQAQRLITPLHVAAAYGHVQCIKIINPQDLDIKDGQLHTPLHYAAAEGHVEVANELVKRGCDVNAENESGNQPLHFAAILETNDLCQVLVKTQKINIDAQNLKGQTALHLATHQCSVDNITYLLESGANPDLRDQNGNTCSHLAIKNGHIDLVKIFMENSNSDTSIVDDEGNTVLHVALKLGHHNIIPIMLPHARDLTRQDANGCNVIIEAIKNQLEDLALDMLRTCPSLVHTATNDLVTPLHLAAERGMTNLTKQLLISGAQVDAADSSGLTPSLYCAKNDQVLECLAMIEDIMMIADNNMKDNDQKQEIQNKSINSKVSSRISS